MENDKYTIELDDGSIFAGNLKLGNRLMIEYCGLVTPINGPYCSWPKTEPRYFTISIGKSK